MKILVNASTLVIGGGIQIGVSFIEKAILNDDFEWLFIVSKGIYSNLDIEIKKDKRIILIEQSPAGIISGISSRKQIKKYEKIFKPHMVYSLGFPSYIRFKSIELGRYTNPWEIYSEPLPWHTIPNLFAKLLTKLGIIYRILWAKRADYIETQTEIAKIGISKRLSFPLEKIFIVPNSTNSIFIEHGKKIEDFESIFERDNIVFCLSAPYYHKNLDLIPFVAHKLKVEFGLSLKFILTISDTSDICIDIFKKAATLNVVNLIQNVGPLNLKECIQYYNKSKIVFLPTLLEIFSATYLEAMAMKVPIITTNLDFAHNNCKDAALYFNQGDATDAARNISLLINNKNLFISQINKGERVLKFYPNLDEKYNMLFNEFKKIINSRK
jgi:glycosyltransferase involved in cell wall biosynthesis